MKKLVTIIGMAIFINTVNAQSIPIDKFHFAVNTPATTDDIYKAGMSASIVHTFVDQDTGISYSTMNIADVQTFCPLAYENGSVMRGDDFNKAYVYLLDRHDNVNNYGWPFKSLRPNNVPAWYRKFAVFTDEYADLASGLRMDPPYATDGLVVCKNSI